MGVTYEIDSVYICDKYGAHGNTESVGRSECFHFPDDKILLKKSTISANSENDATGTDDDEFFLIPSVVFTIQPGPAEKEKKKGMSYFWNKLKSKNWMKKKKSRSHNKHGENAKKKIWKRSQPSDAKGEELQYLRLNSDKTGTVTQNLCLMPQTTAEVMEALENQLQMVKMSDSKDKKPDNNKPKALKLHENAVKVLPTEEYHRPLKRIHNRSNLVWDPEWGEKSLDNITTEEAKTVNTDEINPRVDLSRSSVGITINSKVDLDCQASNGAEIVTDSNKENVTVEKIGEHLSKNLDRTGKISIASTCAALDKNYAELAKSDASSAVVKVD